MWQLSRQNISRKIKGRIFFDPENLPCEKNGPWSDSNETFAAPAVLVNTRVIVQEKRTNCAQIRKGKKGLKLVKVLLHVRFEPAISRYEVTHPSLSNTDV